MNASDAMWSMWLSQCQLSTVIIVSICFNMFQCRQFRHFSRPWNSASFEVQSAVCSNLGVLNSVTSQLEPICRKFVDEIMKLTMNRCENDEHQPNQIKSTNMNNPCLWHNVSQIASAKRWTSASCPSPRASRR